MAPTMSGEWNNLPLLPIRCILEHLSVANALAAMSTCRQWRQAMHLYEGRRATLKLKSKQIERNLFLARLFRRHVKSLHIQINGNERELNKFMSVVMPQFFDALTLKEIVFIGPAYLQYRTDVPLAKLKRIIVESLVMKNAPYIERVAIMGCQIDNVTNKQDKSVLKHEKYSNMLTFPAVTSPEDTIFSGQNLNSITMCTLKHLVLEYESVTTEALETLAVLKNLTQLSLNVSYRRHMKLAPVQWSRVNEAFATPPDVGVNILSLPSSKFKEVLECVFQEGMNLTSLKVMYCNTLYVPLLNQLGLLYSASLRELVWVDCPYDGAEADRVVTCPLDEMILSEGYQQVNPFILLGWQCVCLRRLVIHGYWVWQYDVIGLIRLREVNVEVSSLLPMQSQFCSDSANNVLRVMLYDSPVSIDPNIVRTASEARPVSEAWRPVPWRALAPGLRARAPPHARARYVYREVMRRL